MTLTPRGRMLMFLVILLVVISVPVGLANIYLRSIGLWGESNPGREVEVVIGKGASVNEIGQVLEDAGVVKSAFGFRLATFVDEGSENIQVGTYLLPRGLIAGDALKELLDRGPKEQAFVEVTFPEGSWLTDFAARLDRDTHVSGDEFLELVTSGRVQSKYLPAGEDLLEGLLFPSTYQIVTQDDARSVAERLVREFEERVAGMDFTKADDLGVTPYEAITIASMIEAETFQSDERPMVAAVIYNRLAQGMTLGIDATIHYALGERRQELTPDDLAIDSPYNTRLVKGLPPTPIGAPGLDSIEAALHPADGSWLYYVLVDCDGNHSFSTNYEDFLDDKATYQSLEC